MRRIDVSDIAIRRRRWPGVLVLVLFVSAGILWFFWRDEPPSAPALALMGQTPQSGGDADNAYFALLGFNAAQDIDPAVAGRQILANYESRLSGDAVEFAMAPQAAGSAAALGSKPLRVSRNVLEFCAKQQLMAVECFVKARTDIDKLAEENKVLVQRYQALIQQRGYHNPATPAPSIPYPPFADLQRASNLVWARAVNDLESNHTEAFLSSAERELGFWRMVLRNADNALEKLVAISFLRRNYGLLSDAAATFPDKVTAQNERWLRLAQPLSREETDWSRALAGEFRIGARLFYALPYMPSEEDKKRSDCAKTDKKDCPEPKRSVWSLQHPFWFRTPLYRAQATINRQAENISRLIALTRKPPGQMLVDAKAWREQAQANAKPSPGKHQWVAYNPVGERLADPTIPVERLAQVYDLDGYVRIVNLQIQIAGLKLADQEVGPFLQTTAEEFTDPYTGRAMDWDAKSRTLSFAGHGTGLPPSGLLTASLVPSGATKSPH
jgi:hypothetical protein